MLQTEPRPTKDPGVSYRAGLDFLKRGDFTQAVTSFEETLAINPQMAEARHNLGVALARLGRLNDAIAQFRRVTQEHPDSADAYGNLGLACYQAGQSTEALAAYERLAQLRPDSPDALQNFANLLRHFDRLDDAVARYQQILQLRKDSHDAWHNLGLAYAQMKRPADAEASYREALRFKPDFPEVQNNLGILLEEQGKLDEAVECFRAALKLRPDAPETLSNLGVALAGQGKYQEALGCYYEALRINPRSAEAHNNLGNALRAEGLVEESILHHRRAMELRPDYAEAYNNLGIAHVQQRDFDSAIRCYDRAIELKPDYPDAHMNRSLCYLAVGDFERGWPEYEWRWRGKNMQPRPFTQPLWDGKPLGGRPILLHAEQGLGDTLQFIRYTRLVKERGAEVIFECPRALLPLLSRYVGIDRLVGQGDPLPPFAVHCPLLSLPRLLGTSGNNIPAEVPYLHPALDLVENWQRELSVIPEFKVGIAWQGSPKYKGDRFRSVPLRHFAPLAQVRGARLIALQKGPGVEQLATAGFPVSDVGKPFDEAAGPFMDTAAILKSLDLFITSDSAIAHLAGALGIKVWMVLPFAADWRWLEGREDSPWYPTMRLFRQARRGDWDGVFSRIADELGKVASGPRLVATPTALPRALPGDVVEAERLHRLASELTRQGKLDQAIATFREALALQPNFAAAHHNLGVALAKGQKLTEAIACFRDALRFEPDSFDAHGNLGLALLQQGDPEQAEKHLRRSLQIRHDSAETHNNLGVALVQQGRSGDAAEAYRTALALKPNYAEAHANLARTMLIQGDFIRGWPEYEWRWKTADALPRYLRQPRWDGGALDGKTVLLFAEQGLGDTMQFVRFAPLVKARGGRVVIEVPRQLHSVVLRCRGIDELVAHGDPLPHFDVQAPLLSVPSLLGTTLESVPSGVPYLFADPALVERWARELGRWSGFKVGVVWQGNPSFTGDRLRSVPLETLRPLATIPGVRLISLQKGRGVEQLAAASFSITRLPEPIDEAAPFVDTAAIVKNLDLVVTSDTAMAHLAGGLGVPVWIALPFAADWRWLEEREDSPWYPTMRLFRQARRGDWDGVFSRIANELARRVPAVPAQVSGPSPKAVAEARGFNEEGLRLLKASQIEEAVTRFRRALELLPEAAEANHNLGVALARLGQLEQAIAHFQQALRLRPQSPETLGNLGLAYFQLGRPAESVPLYQEALRLRPDSAETHNNLGVALAQIDRPDEAVPHYRRALELNPAYADAHSNLGNALRLAGQADEAVRHCEKALELKPALAEAHNNLGIALEEIGEMDRALIAYQAGLKLRPDHAETRLNRALCWLAQGKYERGWAEYEWRWKVNESLRPRFAAPMWDGSALGGKTILLHPEQGLGDTIQFIRFAASVKARGGRVLLVCQRALVPLLSRCAGVDQIVPQDQPIPKFDVHCPLMSLPGVLGTRFDTIPRDVPYLTPDPTLVESWGRELASLSGVKVGIAWQGSPKYRSDRFRSIPLRHFAPLSSVPNVRLIPLQKGPGAEQLDTIHFPVTRLSRSIDEDAGAFMDTSAILKNIDLLVTSDSAVAHLAGALGVPVWLALPFAPDWRWMRQREDSPWYPTIRLFRQSRPGDWEGVFHRLVEALAARRPHAGVPTRREDYCQAMQWIAEGRCDDARAILEQMRGEHPDAPDIHHNLGVAMAKLGRLDDAIACFREAVRLRPDSTDAQGNLGLAYLQSNKPADAVACFRAHLAARPDSAETHNNLGVALSKLNQLTDAVIHFSEAIRLKPDYLDALNNLGNAYRGQDRFDDALATYREALKHHPQAAEVHNNLGITFASLLSPDEAVASFREALRLKPDFPEAYNNLGVTLADAHRLDEAVEAFDGALRLKPNHPETHRNRALAWLLQGDYERGWPEYEFRWKCEGVPTRPYPRPCWQGEPIAGKTIFLHCEQGLGDSLQFVRYVPLVKAKGAQVLFECHPSLVPLLSRCEGIDQLIPGGKPVPAFDFHCSLMSLPTIFKTTLATIPAKVPYLTPDPARVEYWRQAMDAVAGFKVAIGWQGSPKYGGDRSRSLPLRHFARLAEIEAVRLISVQKGFGTEQLAALGTSGAPRFPVLDLDRQLDQDGAFVDSAAVLVNVDLVVTSDTALAHLAGGLGVPTWLAVCWPCDWRWLRERTDCPWYPTMRLFRQQRWGDWDGVFSEIADALRLLLDRRKPQTETAAPVSVGELIDKLTILAIKKERIKDETRLANVQTEWAALEEVRARSVPEAPLLRELTAELKTINEALWEIEDEIRDCERAKDFGQRFIDLARSVYHQNDRRAAVKRRINEALGSRLVEEKSYAKYD